MHNGKKAILIMLLYLVVLSGTAQTVNHWETIIKAEESWKYIVPSSEPDTNWRYTGFDDTSWNTGPGGFGYGDSDDRTTVAVATKSVFFRKTFDITDTSVIASLILNADYDDAFVAWINGKEVARGGGLTDRIPAYDKLASYTHEAVIYNGGNPESYLIQKDKLKKILKQGSNVLCVQVHNDAATSSDLTGIIYLSAGIENETQYFQPTPPWFQPPVETGSSNLPIVHINTNGRAIEDEPKIPGILSVMYKGVGAENNLTDTPILECRIGIETRGSSSQMFPKKSFGFETRTALDSNLNVSILGLPADNDWILYAPYDDKTFLRDILAYRLGNLMGHYTPRFVMCELYLNNQYWGVYVLMEKIKQGVNRVNIANLKPEDISGKSLTGGYIFKIDKTTGVNNEGWISQHKTKNGGEITLLYHDPQPDEMQNPQKAYIKFFVNEFEKALASSNFKDELMGYRKFIDVASFTDYFLINELSKNVDGYRISSYFHKDREDRGNKIIAGPLWDYNLGFGNADYYDGASVTGWFYNSSYLSGDYWQVPFWWERFLQDPFYRQVMAERYNSFRQNILKTETIHTYIDSFVNVLQQAQVRNYQKWPILGTYTWPNPFIGATYQQEIDYMKTWISDRLSWMDANIPYLLILDNPELNRQITDELAVIYPNPFHAYLNIEIFADNQAREASVTIHDMTGRQLFQEKVNLNFCEKTYYSLSERWEGTALLSPGVYLIGIKLDTGKEFQAKIIKK